MIEERLQKSCFPEKTNVHSVCVFQATIIAKWPDWEDSPAGIDSYHFEVYHLQPAYSVLVHGDKVLNAVEAKLSPDISEVIS